MPTEASRKAARECSKCQRILPDEEFHRNHRGIRGRSSICRDCKNAYQRRYNKSRAGREAIARSERRFPEKVRARKVVRAAVQRGSLVKPKRCTDCGIRDSLSAHHEDHSRPYDLEWLCSRCHGSRHLVHSDPPPPEVEG